MLTERLGAGAVPRFSSRCDARPSNALDRWALSRVQRLVAGAPITFVLWDGFALAPADVDPVATLVIRNRSVLLSWMWDPELYFGEAYMFGAIEVHGSLPGLLAAIYRALPQSSGRSMFDRDRHDERASHHNVHVHYDLGNDFYRLWLDEELLYTCAFFPDPGASLEQAQLAKMDRVCRKVWLRPGERVFEAGCGWGSLALHMARHYGVTVVACNISREQIAYGRARAAREGLSDRVEFLEADYRHVTGQFDAVVSVGMLEHVGLEQYGALASMMSRVLKPEGRGLLHFIGRDRHQALNRWIRKRIFPGGYPPTLREVSGQVFEPAGLSVLDVENLRLHYAATLRHWSDRFDWASERVTAMFDERFVRAWRLYLAGSLAAFETGTMQLFQIVFSRSGSGAIPWSRPF
jgi:cyclopropane-fatty-acyl-phospholipid synthase